VTLQHHTPGNSAQGSTGIGSCRLRERQSPSRIEPGLVVRTHFFRQHYGAVPGQDIATRHAHDLREAGRRPLRAAREALQYRSRRGRDQVLTNWTVDVPEPSSNRDRETVSEVHGLDSRR